MCGIAGVVDFSGRKVDSLQLGPLCAAMVHRGPDEEGYYFNVDPGVSVGLGHRRLSIIDLKTGHQPIHNEDKTVWVVQNGEIYNFSELRKTLEGKGHIFYTSSDAEVIVHAYEEYGEDAPRNFLGMFAFALWDQKQKKLLLARDRLGKKPLLYALINNKLVFASEFKALLGHPDISRQIDPEALHHYLTYLCVPAPLSIFKGIKKVPPAGIMVFEAGKASFKKYWQVDFSKKLKIGEAEAVARLKELLADAVASRLISDVPLGVLLSGGIDSSCIVALMKQIAPSKIMTFSVGFSEGAFNELPFAKLVADHFHTDHHSDYVVPDLLGILPELVEHYGEPFGDSSALPTYYVCKAAAGQVKVALNGDGGDEVFGGYRRHLANYLAERHGNLARALNFTPFGPLVNLFPERTHSRASLGNLRRFLRAAGLGRAGRYMHWIGFFEEEFKKNLYTDSFRRATAGMDSTVLLRDLFDQAPGLDAIDAALYVDTVFGLQNDLLVKMDIASMANSLETRSPLLDHRLIEFSASLPSNMKIRNFQLKYIFKQALRGLLPEKILARPKKGFAVPVDLWFRHQLKDYLIANILSDRAVSRGYFKAEALKKIVDGHLSGRNNYGQHLWGLLMLELWHRRFID